LTQNRIVTDRRIYHIVRTCISDAGARENDTNAAQLYSTTSERERERELIDRRECVRQIGVACRSRQFRGE